MANKSPAIARHIQSAVDACAAALEGLATSGVGEQVYRVGQTVEIRINTKADDAGTLLSAGAMGEESGVQVPAEVCRAPDDAWLIRFAPQSADEYRLKVMWDGREIDNSPFRLVFRGACEPDRVEVRGLDDGKSWRVGRPVHFCVDTRNAGKGKLIVRASGPTTGVPKFDLHDNGDGTYRAAYVPSAIGQHCFIVTYSDCVVPGSPFMINVAEELDLSMVKVDELTASESMDGMYVIGQAADLIVDATSCKGYSLPSFNTRVSAVTSGTKSIALTSQTAEYVYRVRLQPQQPDTYLLGIYFGTDAVPGSPFRLAFGTAPAPDKVQVLGLKADGWIVGQPVVFHVATNEAGVGQLSVRISPSQADAVVTSNSPSLSTEPTVHHEGSLHTVEFKPLQPGYQAVHVTWAGRQVPGSPFCIAVTGTRPDASRCRLYGEDLQRQYFKIGDRFEVTVNCERAGPGQLQVNATGAIVDESELTVMDKGDGSYILHLEPSQPGRYTIELGWADVAIPGTPIHLYFTNSVDVTKCSLDGDGLRLARVGRVAFFRVVTRGTGLAPLSATLRDPKGHVLPVEIVQPNPGIFQCAYIPLSTGTCTLAVRYGNVEVPGSPFTVQVTRPFAPERCTIVGGRIKDSILGKPIQFYIESTEAGPGTLSVQAMASDGTIINGHLSQTVNGKTMCRLNLPKVDRYMTSVLYGGVHISGSPFKVRVQPPPKPSMVLVYGAGLSNCEVGMPGEFVIDALEAGSGMLGIRVHGPKGGFKVTTSRMPNNEKQILVRYHPIEAGDYDVHITWADEPVPGSPFHLSVTDTHHFNGLSA